MCSVKNGTTTEPFPVSSPKFSFPRGNAKLGKETLTFSLPAGHSCPFAKDCRACANKKTGRIRDGADAKFRCFSATAEAAFQSVRKARWDNWRLVKTGLRKGTLPKDLVAAIHPNAKFVRIHIGGDFYSQAYLDAWIKTAELRPDVIFYAYTKSIGFWLERHRHIPVNLRLTASLGGTEDALAEKYRLPTVRVVFHPKETKLQIDHDDALARAAIRTDFALLIHGCQKKGSPAADAIAALKSDEIPFGYPAKKAA